MKIKVKHVLLFIIVSITIMSFTIYNIVINNDVYEEVDSRNIINNKHNKFNDRRNKRFWSL